MFNYQFKNYSLNKHNSVLIDPVPIDGSNKESLHIGSSEQAARFEM